MPPQPFDHIPLPTDLRIAVLLALSDAAERRVLNRRMTIPLARTLASAWSTQKLANCRALRAAGQTAPPILVTRYRLHDTDWYVVGDGNHRTVAAQEDGEERIDALVGSQVACVPAQYRIDAHTGVLWRNRTDGHPVAIAQEMAPTFVQALRQAGVRYR